MNNTELEKRMTELEMRLSFQDATIDALNAVVAKQQEELAALSAQMKKIKQQQLEVGQVDSTYVKPPHY
jgi:SlyX protein